MSPTCCGSNSGADTRGSPPGAGVVGAGGTAGEAGGAEHGMGIPGELVPSTWCRARATSTNNPGAESVPTCCHHAAAFVALEERGVTSLFLCPTSCSQRTIHQRQVGNHPCRSSGLTQGSRAVGQQKQGKQPDPSVTSLSNKRSPNRGHLHQAQASSWF